MKNIVIFCRSLAIDGYPFGDPNYSVSYIDLLLTLKLKGVNAYFAADNNTFHDGVFLQALTADAATSIDQFDLVENVQPSLVYEKGGFTRKGVAVLNPPFVELITSSKIETYKHFSQFQPTTFVCDNADDVKLAFENIKTDLVVVKEPVGNKGDKVQIGEKLTLINKLPNYYPLIVQEFMDSSVGVPGLAEGIHDVRVEIIGGEIAGGLLRIPKEGELRANVAQGGSKQNLSPEELPDAIVAIAREIDKTFKDYPRHYAADFANTPEGWKLIELNNKPGLQLKNSNPQAKNIVEMLADYLIEMSPTL